MEVSLKWFSVLLLSSVVGFNAIPCLGGITSKYVRRLEASLDMPMDSDDFSIPPGYNAPQQVHITQGNHVGRGVITSWVTPSEPGSSTVLYGPEKSTYKYSAEGIVTRYKYYNYTSGYIHHCTLKRLKGEVQPFKPFTNRYHFPYHYSGSTTPFWYSIKRASTYIIVLSTYSAYGRYTPQYDWLQQELPKVNRTKTPWLIMLMHNPWNNSNTLHYMEGETMRVQFESWFTKYKVDIVFAGHVHAYERLKRVSNVAYDHRNGNCTPVFDSSAPVYINIGDGGNVECLSANYTEPQPEYSAFREARNLKLVMESLKLKTRHMLTSTGTVIKMEMLWWAIPNGYIVGIGILKLNLHQKSKTSLLFEV